MAILLNLTNVIEHILALGNLPVLLFVSRKLDRACTVINVPHDALMI